MEILLMLNWKQNKSADTICFEVKIPRKKQRIVMDWFHQTLTEVMLEIRFVSEERILFLLYFFIYFLPWSVYRIANNAWWLVPIKVVKDGAVWQHFFNDGTSNFFLFNLIWMSTRVRNNKSIVRLVRLLWRHLLV